MREDYAEQLEKMFPKGFIIVHVGNDDSISYYMKNPDLVEQLFQIEDGLIEASQSEE